MGGATGRRDQMMLWRWGRGQGLGWCCGGTGRGGEGVENDAVERELRGKRKG